MERTWIRARNDGRMTDFRAARIYDDPTKNDGYRVLVDRIWPRGISKDDADLDAWEKEIAPSTELRKRFHADDDFEAFAKAYNEELDDNEALSGVVKTFREHHTVTLLTAAKNLDDCHVTVLMKRLS